jgi:uncharacterized protein
MSEIIREQYLETLVRYARSPAIVVVNGLRRVGKSTLLRQLLRRLQEQGSAFLIDMEDLAFGAIRTAQDLSGYAATLPHQDNSWLIVDEVQLIDEWERAVTSIHGRNGVRVIVSGSNATLLGSELATRLAGRYVSLRVMPLSFAEFATLHHQIHGASPSREDLFDLYRGIGGLPGLLHTDLSEDLVGQLQRDVYNTIALRDVVTRHSIRDLAGFEAVARFAMDNVGSLVSANSIARYMKSQGRRISVDTVLNYLVYLTEAFVFDQVSRFDIRGKRHLEVGFKYYLGDLGLRSGFLGTGERWIGGDLENLVYHELLRRGFRVGVGVIGEREIDFVAEKGDTRIYIQVAYLLAERATRDRELRSLLDLPDAYPRVIISMDRTAPGTMHGVRHISAVDFLSGGGMPGDNSPE